MLVFGCTFLHWNNLVYSVWNVAAIFELRNTILSCVPCCIYELSMYRNKYKAPFSFFSFHLIISLWIACSSGIHCSTFMPRSLCSWPCLMIVVSLLHLKAFCQYFASFFSAWEYEMHCHFTNDCSCPSLVLSLFL